jgi:hypothetical protein
MCSACKCLAQNLVGAFWSNGHNDDVTIRELSGAQSELESGLISR